jgi:4-amino-4-deoxy-L-arabinose transferase-like glycosyltransferase
LLAGLVAVFGNHVAVIIVQMLLASFIPLLGYRIARQLFPDARLAAAVGVFLAVEPLAAHLSSTFQVETFFTLLFLGGFTLFLDYWKEPRTRTLLFAMVLLALATLARPTIQFLPILLILAIFFLSRGNIRASVRHSLITIGIFMAVLAPWSIRNVIQFKNPSLSVQSVSVPYAFLVPSAIALEEGIGFSKAQQEFNQGIGGIKDVEDITLENAREYKKRLPGLLLAHPLGLLKSVGVTVLTFFTHDGYLDVLGRLRLDPSVRLERPIATLLFESPKEVFSLAASLSKSPALLIILGRILWVLISICFIIGAVRYLKEKEHRAEGIFILLIVAYFVLTTIAVGLAVNARFRIPVAALILMFAVYGAVGVFEKLREEEFLSRFSKQ